MKLRLMILTLITTLTLTGCLNNLGKTGDDGKVCALYLAMNVASLHFDPAAITGKQFKVKSNGQVVYDTCNGGSQILNEFRYYSAGIDGADASIIQYMSRDLARPTGETFELITRNTCTDPEVSQGTATVSYNFQLQKAPDEGCNHDYYLDLQFITFQ